MELAPPARVVSSSPTTPAAPLPPTVPTAAPRTFQERLPRVRIPMRLKLTLPYAFLALIFAIAGAYVLTQVVVDTLEERYTNQLIEAGTLTADRMVAEEAARLESVRLLANTSGVAAALTAADTAALRALALPILVNGGEESAVFLTAQGTPVLLLRHVAGGGLADYATVTAETFPVDAPFVRALLTGTGDERGDKFAGLIADADGQRFYIGSPVYTTGGAIVGAVLVGRPLEQVAAEMRRATGAQITFYAPDGAPLTSTIGATQPADDLPTEPDALTSVQRDLDLPGITVNYNEILGVWRVRGDTAFGWLGAALPETFLARTSEITRLQIFVLITVGLLIVIAIGILLANRITRPLLTIVNASARVAQGDLNVAVKPEGSDEITVLAHAFNQMLIDLREATERRLREIELVQALEKERELVALKTRFVSMVSHEFRTPLTAILTSSEFLRQYHDTLAPDKRDKHFNRIQTAIGTMTDLLEDVLFIGKGEAGRMQFNPETFDLAVFLSQLTEDMQASIRTPHALVFTTTCDDATITADRKVLTLVFNNLLSNGVKYSPAGGAVRVDVACAADTFTIRVTDSGIGIPEKDQKRLFETFHRAANVSGIGGTGLGLYITKMAVELHNGAITFVSKENQGTTFIVTLPRVKQSEEASP